MKTNNYLEQLGKKAVIESNAIVQLSESRKKNVLKDNNGKIKQNKKVNLKTNEIDIKNEKIKKIKENKIKK